MRKPISLFVFIVVCGPAIADALTTLRAVRPTTVLTESDLTWMATDETADFTDITEIVGLEARVTLYPGRAIRPDDVGPPAIVDRNQFVPLVFQQGNLLITAEGRSLGRGAVGDWVRVLNTASKNTVSGRITSDGRVFVVSK